MTDDPTHARRPLKSRTTRWAQGLAKLLLRAGLHANAISVLSCVFATAAAGAILLASRETGWSGSLLWLAAALGIQLRLLCNLMDGMVAVEGGRRTPDGDLFNEFPDRVSDVVILATAGYAHPDMPWHVALGWAAAIGALLTATVRMHGASLTGHHDFSGPMAKPQRMALITVACLWMAASGVLSLPPHGLAVALGLVVVGALLTTVQRLAHVSTQLRKP